MRLRRMAASTRCAAAQPPKGEGRQRAGLVDAVGSAGKGGNRSFAAACSKGGSWYFRVIYIADAYGEAGENGFTYWDADAS